MSTYFKIGMILLGHCSEDEAQLILEFAYGEILAYEKIYQISMTGKRYKLYYCQRCRAVMQKQNLSRHLGSKKHKNPMIELLKKDVYPIKSPNYYLRSPVISKRILKILDPESTKLFHKLKQKMQATLERNNRHLTRSYKLSWEDFYFIFMDRRIDLCIHILSEYQDYSTKYHYRMQKWTCEVPTFLGPSVRTNHILLPKDLKRFDQVVVTHHPV